MANPDEIILPEGAIRSETLPSGAKAIFFKRKGRALINAQRAADGDASLVAFALLAEIVEIDGRKLVMEDFEELDVFDVLRLQEVFGELGKAAGQALKP